MKHVKGVKHKTHWTQHTKSNNRLLEMDGMFYEVEKIDTDVDPVTPLPGPKSRQNNIFHLFLSG